MIGGVAGQDFALRLAEHVQLSLSGVVLAMVVAVPLGIIAAEHRWLRAGVMGITNVLLTIPSLALLSILLPILGLGLAPAIVALTIYALLPMIQNTVVGLNQLDPVYRQVADSLAMSRWQRLCRIELPLVAPSIMAGIRTSTVWTVGVATICAFIGAGGLGDFINRGLALSNTHLLLVGAIPASLLALGFDRWLAGVAQILANRHYRHWRKPALAISVTVAVTGIFSPALVRMSTPTAATSPRPLVIGCKNWGEQLILAEIIAQLAEKKFGIPVERRLGFGSTDLIHKALQAGAIDLYPEYRGTAENLYVQKTSQPRVGTESWYLETVKAKWMPSLGFENTYALAVRQATADQFQLKSISDLKPVAPRLVAAWNTEFVGREDGWIGLQRTYALHFLDTFTLDAMLVYDALSNAKADVTVVFSTDGRLEQTGLVILNDDRNFFPDYSCIPILRLQALEQFPQLTNLFKLLENRITPQAMRTMNRSVDVNKLAPAAVAGEFIRDSGW